jgi:hypothetical protein
MVARATGQDREPVRALRGSLPGRWQPASLCDLRRLPGCQAARALPVRVRALLRTHARRRLPESWQSVTLGRSGVFFGGSLPGILPPLAACPGQRPGQQKNPFERDRLGRFAADHVIVKTDRQLTRPAPISSPSSHAGVGASETSGSEVSGQGKRRPGPSFETGMHEPR